MKIVLDIGYDIRGRRPGKRLNIAYRFRETVSAEIPEVHPNEAPVAIVWTARKAVEARWRGYDEELACGDVNDQMMTRWYGGRHWLRLVERNCGQTGAASVRELTPAVAAQAASENRTEVFGMLGLRDYDPRSAKTHSNPLGTFDEVARDERSLALEAVSAISDNYISVGGVLHVACAQPAIRVTDSGKMRSYRGFAENIAVEMRAKYLDRSAGYRMGMMSYPIGDWDKVWRMVYDQALDSGAPGPESHLVRPEVYIPESLSSDIDARRAVDTLVKKTLFMFPVFPGVKPRVKAFFDAPSNQRRALLEEILYAPGAALSDAAKNDLMREVEEIEDGMSVDVDLAPAMSRLGI
ncbi:hypothetical protein OIU34_23370 [Pararhizobium sp. BT-229]|uniref:hypothetical protein n=1 Tax=Pararhizobium sp. BT-229 TaxID=2986923 RepID=UPI0021F757BE|nr:hypothetical protein [Pararhizobium sp. BT-229]MCV9964837.1 hypothetical protein [Pararhizobium sp. BT-229]